MSRSIRWMINCAVVCASVSVFGYSNPIEGGSTEVVTNSWSVPVPWMMVGSNSGSNALVVTDGGGVENQIGYLGNTAPSSHNSALVSGQGSFWNNSLELSVGYVGASNSLTVADGGTVTAPNAYLGNISDGNSATVTGTNSLLDAATLNVGHQGSGNRLLITDGGTAQSDNGTIGYWIGSDNNTATVQSNGSWTANELNVGEYGSGNQLIVGAAGLVDAPVVNVGVQTLSSSNTVSVDGSGGILDAPMLYIGGSADGAGGAGNLVEVQNGGTVAVDSLNIYDGNTFALNHGGRLAVSTNFNASMDNFNFNAGGTLEVGGQLTGMSSSIDGERGVVLNGVNAVWDNTGGSIVVGNNENGSHLALLNGGTLNTRLTTLGLEAGSESNTVTVSGGGSVYENTDYLRVGYWGGHNNLNVYDGGRVESEGIYVGWVSGTNNVTVSGDNSVLQNSGGLFVGNWGVGNVISIVDGGTLDNQGWSYIGYWSQATNNLVEISGEGSLWNNQTLIVGEGGGHNAMHISDGGTVTDRDGYVGRFSWYNTAVVSGAGSQWMNSENLYVGANGGSYNTLVIDNGGAVENAFGFVGSSAAAGNSNSVVVSGSGSVWQNTEALYLGGQYSGANWVNGGTGNSLSIADGGWVLVGNVDTNNLHSSVFAVGDGGSVVLANASLLESTDGHVNIGAGTTGSASVVVLGGSVWRNPGEDTLVGEGQGSDHNSILITGEGSLVESGEFTLGGSGSGNTLVVEDGGLVQSASSLMGENKGADGNSALISGVGSGWINTGELTVGERGSDNSIIVSTGGLVQNERGFIGNNAGADGNSVLVAGEGSVWNNSGNMIVGNAGSGNNLSVTNGGRVESATGYIGYEAVASGNEVLVSGAGSVWENSRDLYVGYEGSGNTLRIEDGGLVLNDNGVLGGTSSAIGNAVLITGAGSEWRNANDLSISGNLLYVSNGGLATVGNDMRNANAATVSIDPGSRIEVDGDYYQDADSVLRFGVETNAVGAPLNALMSVGGTAEFEEGATLQYHSNVGVLEFDRFYTNLIVEADQLIVGGVTNANAVELQALNVDGSLVDLLLWEHDQDIYGFVGRRYLAESAGFAPGSKMARLAREIDDLSLLGDPGTGRLINLLNTMSSAQQNAQLTQRFTQGVPTYRHRQGIQGGQKQVLVQSRAFQSANRSRGAAPAGAAGPHKAEQGLRGWIRGYGTWADHEGTPEFSGFEQNVYGTIVGLDKAYGNVLLGAAGGYSRSDLTQDNLDSSDAQTGFGVLYSSFGSVDWFGDINLSYGRSHIETHSGTGLGGEGNFDADNVAVYLGGGKEIQSSEGAGVLLTPEAALLTGYYGQEGYNDGLMQIEAYDRWSIQSRLGAALAVEKQVGSAVIKPEFRTYWLHEFNADPDQIGYSLIGGTGRYYFGMQAPDEDILEIGAGLGVTFNDRLEIVFDIDAHHSDLYRAVNVSGRIMYEF